jgi:hypothetical protein
MKLFRSLRYGLAWLAMGGTALPPSTVLGQEVSAGANFVPPAVHDVALAPGGVLVGQVLDETMRPVASTAVAIHVNGQAAATTATDANGVFAVAGLRGGAHQLVVGGEVENCRLWAPETAPPHAATHLRFVPGQQTVVRGQWGPPPSHNSLKAWATNPWVIGGVVATAIAVPVILHNLDDDDDNGS